MTETPEQRRGRLAMAAIRAELIECWGATRGEAKFEAIPWHKPIADPYKDRGRAIADAILASDEAAGMVVVPVEPTDGMIRAGWCFDDDVRPDDIYAAMIAAANGVSNA